MLLSSGFYCYNGVFKCIEMFYFTSGCAYFFTSSSVIVFPHNITSLSTTFCNSLMFPVHL